MERINGYIILINGNIEPQTFDASLLLRIISNGGQVTQVTGDYVELTDSSGLRYRAYPAQKLNIC